jgi:uncharacterized membrane protein YeaQ/YmgE (transglycosylase-associated protein family)
MDMATESILVILVVGIVAGWLAGKIVRGTGFGLIGDLLVGIAGAFVAAWLFPRLGIRIGTGIIWKSPLGAGRDHPAAGRSPDPRTRQGSALCRKRDVPGEASCDFIVTGPARPAAPSPGG